MKLYWVSAIIQNRGDSKPWLCSMNEGELDLNNAIKVVNRLKSNYNVLSAWVDVFDGDNIKHTVFHECYINAFGEKNR